MASRKASIPAIPPPAHTDDEVREHFARTLVPQRDAWVAEAGATNKIIAVLVLDNGWVDQLYVHPDHTGQGIGTEMIELAKDSSPTGLQLWTFQSNTDARRFYERHGFVAVEMTDGQANEERSSDVRYEWHQVERGRPTP